MDCGRKDVRRSIADAQFLCVRRQLVGNTSPLLVILRLVDQEIIEPNAPVLTDQAKRDLSILEQTDQVRSGDIIFCA
jgi:hypothetical protein